MTEIEKNPGKSICEQLLSIVAQLSADQIRFVVARQQCGTDKEAAEPIDIKPDTVYHWPKIVREAARLWATDGMIVAKELRERNLAKAMLVKIGGLDSDAERVRQGVATELIEWEMGKATQSVRQQITGDQVIRLEWPDEGGVPPATRDPEGGA